MGLWSSPGLWDQTGVLLGNFCVYFSTRPRNAQGTTASCVWVQLCEDTLSGVLAVILQPHGDESNAENEWTEKWTLSSCILKIFSSVQLLSYVLLFAIPWTAAHQASLSFTTSQSLLKLVSIESVMPSNRLILCRPLLLLPLICPHIRVFPHESALCIRWPKY